MKFKNCIKQKDESLPEMAEDIEWLCRLARDQFVDALPDEDTRLRIKQEKPRSLRKGLESALELESFQIAARQRLKVSREAELLGSTRPSGTEQKQQGKFHQLEEGKLDHGDNENTRASRKVDETFSRWCVGSSKSSAKVAKKAGIVVVAGIVVI